MRLRTTKQGAKDNAGIEEMKNDNQAQIYFY